MPEMRETLTKTIQAAKTRVQEGKAKLVGLGRPKERLQVEVAGQEVSIPDETDQLTVTFTGVSGVKQEAQRGADIWLEKKPGEKPSLSSLARDIWKKTLGRPYFHHREQMYHEEVIAALGNDFKNKATFEAATAQAEREYQEHLKNINVIRRAGRRGLEFVKSATGEVFGQRTWTRQRTLDILRNATGRMQTETLTREVNGTHTRLSEAELENNDAIRTKMGEQVALLNADPAARAVVDASRSLMREYATTTMADVTFTEKSRELWQQLKQLKPEYFKAADFYTSSLFESAKALRVIAGHANGTVRVQNLVETAQFRIAYGKMGAATQTETAYTNRAVEWTHQHLGRFEQTPLGALLLNEATVGASAGLGIAGIQTATRTLATGLGRIVVPVFGGSAVGGAFAAAREYGAMGRQRLVHILEKEIGLSVPTTGKRREIMERFAPAQVAATEVLAKLRLPTDQNADSLRAFAGTVTDIQARLNMSAQAQNRIGLITFTKDQMERERADIYRAMRQARKHLTGLDAATTQAITGSPDVTMDTFLQNRTGIRTGEINKELYDLNQAFNVVRGKEAAKHGLKAAGVGVATGVAGRLIGEMLHPTTAFEELAARTKVAAPTFRKAVGEMGKTRGLRGPWGWFEEHFSTANHNAKTNFAKNLLRGYEENVDHYQHVTGIPKEQFPWRIPGKLLNYNAMSKKLTFEVPERLFGDHALSLQDSIMEDAVKFHAGTLQNLTNNPLHLDAGQYKKLLEFFYTVGPGDHIPTAAEIAHIDELLGGAQPPVEVAAEVVRETISPPPIPIGFHMPLEGLEGIVAASTPTAPMETPAEKPAKRLKKKEKTPSVAQKIPSRIRPIVTPRVMGIPKQKEGKVKIPPETTTPHPAPEVVPVHIRADTEEPELIVDEDIQGAIDELLNGIQSAPSEIVEQPTETLESTQTFPKEVEFRSLVQTQAQRILNKALSDQYRFKNGILEGHVRGRLAEITSSMLSTEECETVFTTSPNRGSDIRRVHAVTFETALNWQPGEVTKEKVLGRALERASKEQKEELVRRLATPGAKTLYEASVMPDGLLLNNENVIVGFTEVKAYTPQEFDIYLQRLLELDRKGELHAQPHSPKITVVTGSNGQTMELGPDIDREITFVDELRFLGFGDERLQKGTAILLRFPSDVSSASLQQFGELLRDKFGYEHIMIQKLPISSKQLAEYEQGIRRNQAPKMLEQAENGSYRLSKEGIEEEQSEKLRLLRAYCS